MKNLLLLILAGISFSLYGQNSLKSSVYEEYNGSTWDKLGGVDYEYVNNKLSSATYYSWSGTDYEVSGKTTYTYNSENKIFEEITMVWNNTLGQLENWEKCESFYNSSGEVIEHIVYNQYASNWKEIRKFDITHVNSNISQVNHSYRSSNQWVFDSKIVNNYTGNNLTQADLTSFDGTQWKDDYRYILSYDANDRVEEFIGESSTNSVWTEFDRYNYNLDANFNRISKYAGDVNSAHVKIEYDYDLSAQMANYAHPFQGIKPNEYVYEDFPFVNKILKETTFKYDTLTGIYKEDKKTTYNYNDYIVLSTDNIQQIQKVSLYPNPANDFIQVKGISKHENVSVYSVLGMKVFDSVINENEKLDIKGLNNGMYLLKFEDGTALKFLKK
ncbi:T9SS type A sorting domain-containing protein [Brumimicrobium glaciale]|uniref:T9SS type A sorting domain-containing protein n=1 Tax=Brumimicrobium glaciale TaxID=200475 RepID=A0A4Q4KPW8_9FLAO|nr:T9SS type A sorting domain-containing protein [Brumimicrobium glaciale]RYM34584.1 T9SS type A sorting domain-containing protein [Brumimicrobium glaciale]